MSVKAVIFDLDGTLYNKAKLPLRLALSQFLRCKLLYLKREQEVRKMLMGKHFKDASEFGNAFFAAFGKPDAENWYHDIYMPDMLKTLSKHYKAEHWVNNTLSELKKKGIKTAVFSDYENVDKKLKVLGIETQLIDYQFSAPNLFGLKPCKESFLAVCGEMGIEPENCIMVGDRYDTDGAGANAAGMRFILTQNAEKPLLGL